MKFYLPGFKKTILTIIKSIAFVLNMIEFSTKMGKKNEARLNSNDLGDNHLLLLTITVCLESPPVGSNITIVCYKGKMLQGCTDINKVYTKTMLT